MKSNVKHVQRAKVAGCRSGSNISVIYDRGGGRAFLSLSLSLSLSLPLSLSLSLSLSLFLPALPGGVGKPA